MKTKMSETSIMATLKMVRALGNRLNVYDKYTNAFLASTNCIEGPLWVIELNVGKVQHYAIWEKSSGSVYIYMGSLALIPNLIVGQTFNIGKIQLEVYLEGEKQALRWEVPEKVEQPA